VSVGQRGLALVEVVAAVAVFGVVAAVLTGFFVISSTRGLLGRDATTAALLAQQRIEQARSRSYASLPSLAGTEVVDALGAPAADGPYTRTTVVTTPVLGTPRLTQIDVSVSWMDQAVPRQVTLSTLVVQR
jgi:prepilin-type N-terminal cleavage/methylation domain-containing protein